MIVFIVRDIDFIELAIIYHVSTMQWRIRYVCLADWCLATPANCNKECPTIAILRENVVVGFSKLMFL
jgi:hypothetical protein